MDVRLEDAAVDATGVIDVVGPEGNMPTTSPGPDRSRLGFADVVNESFAFLVSRFGFRLVDAQPTFVRYESERAFVNVFHGRGSYELGVEIGHWVDLDDDRVEERFPLGDVIALDHDPSTVGYRSFATTEKEPLARFVAQLAEWMQRFAPRALEGDVTTFDRLRVENARQSQATQEGWRVSRLRSAADEAWHRKDWGRVVDAYREMVTELRTVELKPSELRRLRYAQERLDSPR